MKYIGNKTRLLDFINDCMKDSNLPISGTFIDIFGGTGSVGSFFKKQGYKIISNDFMTYSYIVQYVLISINKMPDFKQISDNGIIGALDILNNPNLMCKDFIFDNFAPDGTFKRQYFSNYNAMRIDAIRNTIEKWNEENKLSKNEYMILLSALIDSADFVANISGTYGAYLKIWRSMALKKIQLKIPNIYDNKQKNIVYQENANTLITKISGDILYLDPPYNERQYASNFHLLETLAIWDKPKLKGKTGQRDYSDKKSLYCQKAKSVLALQELVNNANVKYIILSYNNEGIIPREDIIRILNSKGQVKEYIQEYRRFRTEKDNENRHYKDCNDKVNEHLYIVNVK